mgnify:CR=1 FL=1
MMKLLLAVLMFMYGRPVFFTAPSPPHRFEYFQTPKEIQGLEIDSCESALVTPAGIIHKGQKKTILWEKLIFVLNLAGLCPLNGTATKLRLENNNTFCAFWRKA